MLRSADLSQDSPLESAAPPFRISIPSQFSPVTPFDGLFETGPPPTTPEGPIGEGADLAVRLVHEQARSCCCCEIGLSVGEELFPQLSP
ncbi:uncharacterized protein LOC144092582 isoform X2 [Stigmatopora argus]